MGDYLCAFMYIYIYIYIYMVIIYLKNCKIVIIYFYFILKVYKKTNILLKIYPHNTLHNNLRYIA